MRSGRYYFGSSFWAYFSPVSWRLRLRQQPDKKLWTLLLREILDWFAERRARISAEIWK
jgi:hypothetical protein